MERIHVVESSDIGSVGYDPAQQLLEIKFCSTPNFVYQYAGVPQDVFDGLREAPSKIDYFTEHIKSAFRVRQVPRVESNVVVQDPVDAYALFTACLAAVGMRANAKWDLGEFNDEHVLRTKPGQDASALVRVHFAPDGGLRPGDEFADSRRPDGYAHAAFVTPGFIPRSDHESIVQFVGQWLTNRGLRYSWSHEDEPWIQGFQGGI